MPYDGERSIRAMLEGMAEPLGIGFLKCAVLMAALGDAWTGDVSPIYSVYAY